MRCESVEHRSPIPIPFLTPGDSAVEQPGMAMEVSRGGLEKRSFLFGGGI